VKSRRIQRGMSRKLPSTPMQPFFSDFSGSVTSFAGSMP
jgi:hypothetical protein